MKNVPHNNFIALGQFNMNIFLPMSNHYNFMVMIINFMVTTMNFISNNPLHMVSNESLQK